MEHDVSTTRAVRISLPASVANDIGSVKGAYRSVLEKLGCPNCCSGHDIYMEIQKDVVLQRDLRDEVAVVPSGRSGAIGLAGQRTVQVAIKPEIADDIQMLDSAIERVAELSGHTACMSGHDWAIVQQATFVFNANKEMKELALKVGF